MQQHRYYRVWVGRGVFSTWNGMASEDGRFGVFALLYLQLPRMCKIITTIYKLYTQSVKFFIQSLGVTTSSSIPDNPCIKQKRRPCNLPDTMHKLTHHASAPPSGTLSSAWHAPIVTVTVIQPRTNDRDVRCGRKVVVVVRFEG
jgi:hypothetical protein